LVSQGRRRLLKQAAVRQMIAVHLVPAVAKRYLIKTRGVGNNPRLFVSSNKAPDDTLHLRVGGFPRGKACIASRGFVTDNSATVGPNRRMSPA
jgi:hypothetical protein